MKPMTGLHRRQFVIAIAAALGGGRRLAGAEPASPKIRNVRIDRGVAIEADDGTTGFFTGSHAQDLAALERHLPEIRKLVVGRDPFDVNLNGELLWESILPGRPSVSLWAKIR